MNRRSECAVTVKTEAVDSMVEYPRDVVSGVRLMRFGLRGLRVLRHGRLGEEDCFAAGRPVRNRDEIWRVRSCGWCGSRGKGQKRGTLKLAKIGDEMQRFSAWNPPPCPELTCHKALQHWFQ